MIMDLKRFSVSKAVLACVIIVVLCCSYYINNMWSSSDKIEMSMMRDINVQNNNLKKGTKSHNIQVKTAGHVKRKKDTNRKIFATADTGVYRYRDVESSKRLPWKYDHRFKNPCWYATGTLKCLPFYFIIGMRKCGTTALYESILKHPESINTGFKEAQFFGWKTRANVTETEDIFKYIQMFSSGVRRIHNYSETHPREANRLIIGDASPSYIHFNIRWKEMPGNEYLSEPKYVILDYIHKILPNAKLIVSFRDPVDRLYSEYLYFTNLRNSRKDEPFTRPDPHTFHRIVKRALSRFKDCLQNSSLRSCVYNPELYGSESIQLGIHHVYWEELMRLFPRKQIHVVQMKDIGSTATIRGVFEFLEMSEASDEVIQSISMLGKVNSRPRVFSSIEPMLNITRDMLYDFYMPYNIRMTLLIGDIDFLYPKR